MTVDVEITPDTARFQAGMKQAAESCQRLELAIIDIQDRRRVRMFDKVQLSYMEFDRHMRETMAMLGIDPEDAK